MVQGLKVVVGLGITGLSVVNYLLAQGNTVAVTDSRESPPNVESLPESVACSFGKLDEAMLLSADEIIISPGLSLETPEIAKAIAKGIPVVGDVHLLAQAIQNQAKVGNPIPKLIAITGSNAKSTVTTLVAKMAEQAGIKVAVGGNLGQPALELLVDNPEMIVLEVSSFQLESTTNLSADVACILNLSADHLDRHHTMAEYLIAKQRVFQQAKSAVINREDDSTTPPTSMSATSIPSKSFGLSAPTDGNYGLVVDTDGSTWIAKGAEKLINSDSLKIKGQHNLLNAMAAVALGELAGIPQPAMLETLVSFRGLPHRCEFVDTVDGIDFFNDSKGTNVGSTLAAITGLGQSYQSIADNKKMYLILGGEGKGQDFSLLDEAVSTHVKEVFLIGRDATVIADSLAEHIIKHQVQTLEKAVEHVQHHATAGDLVLLSPACASFDQFASYVARGEYFVDLVKNFKSIR